MSAFTVCWIFQVDILGIKTKPGGFNAVQNVPTFSILFNLNPNRNWPNWCSIYSRVFLTFYGLYFSLVFRNWSVSKAAMYCHNICPNYIKKLDDVINKNESIFTDYCRFHACREIRYPILTGISVKVPCLMSFCNDFKATSEFVPSLGQVNPIYAC